MKRASENEKKKKKTHNEGEFKMQEQLYCPSEEERGKLK